MNARTLAGAVAALVIAGSAANAQQPRGRAPKPAGPRTIVGVVTDTSDNLFVDSAQVYLNERKRHTTSALDGTFRFDDVDEGTYTLRARRFGYLSQVRTVVVDRNGGAVRFELLPFAQALPAMVASSTVPGLSGVIGDTAYSIVPGAEVWAVATDRRATTDSLGQFALDVKPGKYMVRISRAGFVTKMISVTVPRDSGRRLVATLAPATRANNREAMVMFELARRLATASATRSKLLTREDIERTNFEELSQVATAAAGQRVDDGCMAILDGGPQAVPIWALSAAELETVEVYASKRPLNTITSINGNRPIRTQVSPTSACPVTVYAWLRK